VLGDQPVEDHRGGMVLTTDRHRIDVGAALGLLQTTNWARALAQDALARSIDNSVCFAVLDLAEGGRMVGFARVVTDLATYGYLTDVVVAADRRGHGIGSWLVERIIDHPDLQGLRRLALLTAGAAPLYAKYGFVTSLGDLTYMERKS
jgi:GNAT superfamily N-acetyltransferase